MGKFSLKMPKLGESITEATITKWLKNVGDVIALDDPILEIATDKVDSEIPSPVEGILTERLFNEGDVVAVEVVIASIETDIQSVNDRPSASAASIPAISEETKTLASAQSAAIEIAEEVQLSRKDGDRFYSPLVRTIARDEKITFAELEKIPGSGSHNRLTRKDVMDYLAHRINNPVATATATAPAIASAAIPAAMAQSPAISGAPAVSVNVGDTVIEMTRIRRLIADHMVMSEATAVHITLFAEADVTNLVHWRNKNKGTLEAREGEKLTFTPIFIQSIAKALRDFPMVNVSASGNNIIVRKNVNIGMAVATSDGNLIVPVIRNVDHKSLLGLTKEVNDFAARGRVNQLKPEEIQGGTFTLTNFGSYGAIGGTPIINQPQVAILGVGLIQKKPVVIETPQGESIGIRHMMMLSLSCDHRVVDGALGSMFMKRVAEYLEKFDVSQAI